GERRDDEPGQHRVRDRLGGVALPVQQDPHAERAAGDRDHQHLDQRALHEGAGERVEQPVEHQWSWWWCSTATARSPPGSTTSSAPYVRRRTSVVSVSAGGPTAICSPCRQTTWSQRRACSTSWVATSRTRPSARSSPNSSSMRAPLAASTPLSGSSSSITGRFCSSARAISTR